MQIDHGMHAALATTLTIWISSVRSSRSTNTEKDHYGIKKLFSTITWCKEEEEEDEEGE
jgi:hypothetical protein